MSFATPSYCIDTEDKSLLPSLCQREELPLSFDKLRMVSPVEPFGKEGGDFQKSMSSKL
jgi:hypothetical protein